MGRMYAILLDAKGAIQDIERMPPDVAKAARIAVNTAADRARTLSARAVLSEVNFPASYVSSSNQRLAVTLRARDNNPVAQITARGRPTSLARFAKGGRPGKAGARVQVKPGVARYLPKAVFVKLRSGTADVDTAFNLGLAVRTANGKKPDRAYAPVRMKNGMWLLYGPSVSQALLNAKESGIWPDLTDEILDILNNEFTRQLELNHVL